jgi:hypothetical protein
MQSELEKVSAEIDQATRCIGDGMEEQAADHLAVAAALLETLVCNAPVSAASDKKLAGRSAAA